MAREKSGPDQDTAGTVFNWPPGSASINQNYGSLDPDPNEKCTFPRHFKSYTAYLAMNGPGVVFS